MDYFTDPFNDHVLLSDENTNNLRRLGFLLDLLSLWLLQALSKDESELGSGGEHGVQTKCFIESSNSCFKFLAAYRAKAAMTAEFLETAEANFANEFEAVAK